METEQKTERVVKIVVPVEDGTLDGDEVASDEEYEAYCQEYEANLRAAYPGATVEVVRVDPNWSRKTEVELEPVEYQSEDEGYERYQRYLRVCEQVDEIGQDVFNSGSWAR